MIVGLILYMVVYWCMCVMVNLLVIDDDDVYEVEMFFKFERGVVDFSFAFSVCKCVGFFDEFMDCLKYII